MELRLGEKQTLVIVKKVEFGVYLATKEAPEDKVLLPAKQVPEGAKAARLPVLSTADWIRKSLLKTALLLFRHGRTQSADI